MLGPVAGAGHREKRGGKHDHHEAGHPGGRGRRQARLQAGERRRQLEQHPPDGDPGEHPGERDWLEQVARDGWEPVEREGDLDDDPDEDGGGEQQHLTAVLPCAVDERPHDAEQGGES